MGLHSIKQYYYTVRLRMRCIRLLETSQGVSTYTHGQLFNLYVQLVSLLKEIEVIGVHGPLSLDVGIYSHYKNYTDFIEAHNKDDGPLRSGTSGTPVFHRVHDWFDLSISQGLPNRLNRLLKLIVSVGDNQTNAVQDSSDRQYVGRVYQSIILDNLTILELCLYTCDIRSNLCRMQE